MYNLIEYSENYSQRPGSLSQYYRDQPALNDDDNIIGFPVNDDTSFSFKYKKNTIVTAGNNGTKNTEIWVSK